MMFFMVPSSIEDEEFEQTGRLTPCASASASADANLPVRCTPYWEGYLLKLEVRKHEKG